MQPFDDYPGRGRELIGAAIGGVCRRGYGLSFMRKTGRTQCAYCNLDFTAAYEFWLNMALDHVVPASVCRAFDVPAEWREDCSNKVLACAACNGFKNRYKPTVEVVLPIALEDFYNLRDHIFADRRALILASHDSDRAFFAGKPWESR